MSIRSSQSSDIVSTSYSHYRMQDAHVIFPFTRNFITSSHCSNRQEALESFMLVQIGDCVLTVPGNVFIFCHLTSGFFFSSSIKQLTCRSTQNQTGDIPSNICILYICTRLVCFGKCFFKHRLLNKFTPKGLTLTNVSNNSNFAPSKGEHTLSLSLSQSAVILVTIAVNHSSNWTAAQMEVC